MSNLQFSYEQHQYQPVQWDLMSPPVNIQLNVPVEFAQYTPMVTSSVINEIAIKSVINPLRMFTHNAVASNGYNNSYLQEAVQIAMDGLIIMVRKNLVRSPEMGIKEAAERAATMYTSKIIFDFPELKSVINPKLLNACQQNMATLQELRQQGETMVTIANSQQQQVQYVQTANGLVPVVQQVPQQQVVQVQPQQQQVQYVQTANGLVAVVQQQPQQQQVQFVQGPNGTLVAANVGQMNTQSRSVLPSDSTTFAVGGGSTTMNTGGDMLPRTSGRYGNVPKPEIQVNTHQAQRAAPAPAPVPVAIVYGAQDWLSSNDQRYRTLVKNTDVVDFKQNANGNIIESVLEMDRNRHSLANIYSNLVLSTPQRFEKIADSASTMADMSPSDIKNPREEDKAIVEAHVLDSTIPTLYLEEAIYQARRHKYKAEMKAKATNTIASVFRTFALVGTPYVTDFDMSFPMAELRRNGFNSVHSLFEMFSKMIDNVVDEREKERCYMFAKGVDDTITGVVNDFLVNKMGLKLTIDSFKEDWKDIPGYLEKEYGNQYSSAWFRFEAQICKKLFLITEEDLDLFKKLATADDPGEEEVGASIIPVCYSITMLDATAKELDFDLNEDESKVIEEGIFPDLFQIVKNALEHAESRKMRPIYNLLITQDGVVYKMHEAALGMKCYLLSK